MTLDAIADDFENFEMILNEVRRWSSEELDAAPSEQEVAMALISLVEDGLAQAYSFDPGSNSWKVIPISLSVLSDPSNYFLVTAKGKQELKSKPDLL
jgi:hypothetical protein